MLKVQWPPLRYKDWRCTWSGNPADYIPDASKGQREKTVLASSWPFSVKCLKLLCGWLVTVPWAGVGRRIATSWVLTSGTSSLQPENILCVTSTGHMVKIIDFGLARR